MWSCAVVAISCCNTVPVAPALPSQGPGLCAVPARGALAILRGHSWFCPTQPSVQISRITSNTEWANQGRVDSWARYLKGLRGRMPAKRR